MPRSPFENTKKPGSIQKGTPAVKKQGFRKRSNDAPEWDGVDDYVICGIVRACTTRNHNPTFSYVADGTSLVIAIYHAGERMTDFISGPAEMREYFAWLLRDHFELTDEECKYYGLGALESA